MKGPKLLKREERFEIYRTLALEPLSFSEKDLVSFIQNARLDPRLAEVTTEHLRDFWWKYEPEKLNRMLKRQPWPAAVKPMLFQILEHCGGDRRTRAEFLEWTEKLTMGIGTVSPQLYFVPTLSPRSRSLDREVGECLPSFRKAGFLAKDLLFNKGLPGLIKAKPQVPNQHIKTADLLKLELLERIRPFLARESSPELQKRAGIDRTTLSDLRLGRLNRLSLKKLSRIADAF